MEKKEYLVPTMIVKNALSSVILAGSIETHNAIGYDENFSKGIDMDDEETNGVSGSNVWED